MWLGKIHMPGRPLLLHKPHCPQFLYTFCDGLISACQISLLAEFLSSSTSSNPITTFFIFSVAIARSWACSMQSKTLLAFPHFCPNMYIHDYNMQIACMGWWKHNSLHVLSHQTCFAVHFPCRHSCKLWCMHMRKNIVSSYCLLCIFTVCLSVPPSMSYHFHLLCILTYSQFQSHEYVTAVLYNLLHQSCTLTAHKQLANHCRLHMPSITLS